MAHLIFTVSENAFPSSHYEVVFGCMYVCMLDKDDDIIIVLCFS